ncbi:MAG: bile acid:sodium symporter [Myxococcota bacterium]
MKDHAACYIVRAMQALQAIAETYLVPLQLLLAMFGMGATLGVRDFAVVLKDPRGLALGLALQLFFVPLVALLLITAFQLGPGWAVGLVLVAAVPGGATSNLLTFLGKGSVPLSIAVTTASTLGCVLTVPLLLELMASQALPADFVFPIARVFRDIGLYLFAPLAVGMVVYRWSPERSKVLSTWAIRGSVAVVITIAVAALGSGRIEPLGYGLGPPAILVLFMAVLFFVTPHLIRLAGRSDPDAVALTIEVVVRNIGIALLLVHYFFPTQLELQGHVLFSCLFFSGLSAPFAIPIIVRHRLGKSPALGRR